MLNESNFRAVFARFQESGLTIKDFCANELIAPSTFYYWRKKWQKVTLVSISDYTVQPISE
jgi:hypothetical protein